MSADSPLRHLPNLICVVRILLVVPIVWLLLERDFALALLLVFIAGVSDGVDGFLAKRFGWHSRLGSLLDPAADKLLLASLFVTLTWLALVPLWLTIVVVLRDVLLSAGSLYWNAFVERLTARPSLVSKLNTGLQLAYVLAVMTSVAFAWPPVLLVEIAGAMVFVSCCVSGIDYSLSWSRRIVGLRGRAEAA